MSARRDLFVAMAAAMGILVILLALPTTQSDTATDADAAFVIVDALVFDGTQFLPDTDILIENGRVRSIGEGLRAGTDTIRVDGHGKTVFPGLIDSHTHVYGNALADALRFGVTTELDMFMSLEHFQVARRTRSGVDYKNEADLFSAGTLVTAAGGHGTQFGLPIPTLESPENAAGFVADRVGEGSDYIKLVLDDGQAYAQPWPTLSEETVRAVVQAAQSHNVLVVAHVSALADAKSALRAGVDGLVHLFADASVDQELIDLFHESGAFVVPTLCVLESLAGRAENWYATTPAGARLSTDQERSLAQKFSVEHAAAIVRGAENLRSLYQAGIPVLAGTDAPNPGTAHGLSLHREMQLMATAGMPIAEVLRSATSLPAEYFPLGERGRIHPGARADLVMVQGDLRTDIAQSINITDVWKNGFRLESDVLGDTASGSRGDHDID